MASPYWLQRHYTLPSVHVERMTLRTDGFVSVHAGYEGGELLTRPLIFEGNNIAYRSYPHLDQRQIGLQAAEPAKFAQAGYRSGVVIDLNESETGCVDFRTR